MKVYIIVLSALVFSCKTPSPTSGSKPNTNESTLLWEITGKDLKKPAYLFGTFHLMCKEDISFSNNLKDAIKKSDEVYFELDLDDLSGALGLMASMNMSEGKTLKDFLSPAEYARVADYFKDTLKTSLAGMERMKPLFLMSLLYPKLMPCKKMSGVEQELMKIAKENNKEIKGFETVAFQASMFDVIPYRNQAQELLKAIDSMGEYRKNFSDMLNVYKMQQLNEIENLFTKAEFGLEENKDILLYNRNKNWIEILKKILTERSPFIAVGAGHLVGEKGVIALMKKEGYTLRPLDNH